MQNRKTILKEAENLRDFTSKNLSELIKRNSISTKEKDTALLTKKLMEDAGFDEVFIDGLGNVIGRIGNGSKVIAFDGHIDVVDAGNRANWTSDPFGGEIKDGFVHGRGSVDQKGGVASFITAGKILKMIGPPDDKTIYFTATVMEEDCDGLCWKYIIEEDNIKPECVIVTEPTNLGIYRGQRGRMEIEVSFKGISSHGSAPERGRNAIYEGAKTAIEVEKLNDDLISDPFLGKGTITVTEIISSSPSLCAVADYCRIHLDRRLTWGENQQSSLDQIENITKSFDAKVELVKYKKTAYTGLEYGMDSYFPTWKLDEDNEYIMKAKEVFLNLFEQDPLIDKWTFSTNGVTINGVYGIPVIGFGPGNEVLAHAPNEKVEIDQLVKASSFYALLSYLI